MSSSVYAMKTDLMYHLGYHECTYILCIVCLVIIQLDDRDYYFIEYANGNFSYNYVREKHKFITIEVVNNENCF